MNGHFALRGESLLTAVPNVTKRRGKSSPNARQAVPLLHAEQRARKGKNRRFLPAFLPPFAAIGKRRPPRSAKLPLPLTQGRFSAKIGYTGYHQLTRANTPASASFRLFLLFSPWRASARLRLKSQKSLENPSLTGAKQFCRSEMCPDKERPAENTAVLSRDLTQYGRISVRQNRVCPCQLMVK